MTCCKTAATRRQLDETLAQGFPASNPAALAEVAGDARDAAGCGCAKDTQAPAAPAPAGDDGSQGCCGGKG
jgi:hypothetical protein